MLLCGIEDVRPGMAIGAVVLHPLRPNVELLRPGVPLNEPLIRRLAAIGIHQLWVHHPATVDLDHAPADNLAVAGCKVYDAVRLSFQDLSAATFFSGHYLTYKTAVTELINQLLAGRDWPGLGPRLLADEGALFAHSANVAYLSLLLGLELEPYVVRERNLTDPAIARDLTNLGLAAILHDVGKVQLSSLTQARHEIDDAWDAHYDESRDDYLEHPMAGFQLLSASGAPATIVNTILHHHQRFDGRGWPNMTDATNGRKRGALHAREIHIFSRIVAAANVLDNLMRDEFGHRRPMVAALHDLAARRFDGWFDPVVRDCTLRRIAPFPVGSHVTLSNGIDAVVVAPSYDRPCRPLVRPLPIGGESPQPINLAQRPDLSITHCSGAFVRHWHFEVPTMYAARSA